MQEKLRLEAAQIFGEYLTEEFSIKESDKLSSEPATPTSGSNGYDEEAYDNCLRPLI